MAEEVYQSMDPEIVQMDPAQNSDLPNVIQIGTVEAFVGIAATLLGIIATLVTAAIGWGKLHKAVSNIEKKINNEVVPDLKDVRERFGVVEDRVETLWKERYATSHSPRELNERGKQVLKKSGITEIIDKKKEALTEIVIKEDPKNAYDAENVIEKTVMQMPKFCPDVLDGLKQGAFRTGTDINVVLFVGSLYLRNKIFHELGFSLSDLDEPEEESN